MSMMDTDEYSESLDDEEFPEKKVYVDNEPIEIAIDPKKLTHNPDAEKHDGKFFLCGTDQLDFNVIRE